MEIEDDGVVSLLEKVISFNTLWTSKAYQDNVKRLFELMNIGQLYQTSKGDCFFKIQLQQNYKLIEIYLLIDNVIEYKQYDPDTVFANKEIVLHDRSTYYKLYVSIRKYDGR